MKRVAATFIKEHEVETVVSGGAAWADHLAVGLYNAGLVPNLILFLPCSFFMGECRFLDTGMGNARNNPGFVANYYHRNFSKAVGINSLEEIKNAINKGCAVKEGGGFLGRNKFVAQKADILLAFTFGNGNIVKDGGTAHTTKEFLKSKKEAFHCDLNTMKVYSNAEVK